MERRGGSSGVVMSFLATLDANAWQVSPYVPISLPSPLRAMPLAELIGKLAELAITGGEHIGFTTKLLESTSQDIV